MFRPQMVCKKYLLKNRIANKNWLKRRSTYTYGIPNLDHAARMCGYLHTRGSHGYTQDKWYNIARNWMQKHKKLMEKL